MKNKYASALLNIALNISPHASNLRDKIYSNLVLWTLHIEDRELSLKEIKKGCAKILNKKNLPEEAIESGIELLSGDKSIIQKGNKWMLNPSTKNDISRKLEFNEKNYGKILKLFPSRISLEKKKKWFLEACKDYFSADADKLVARINKKQTPVVNVAATLKRSISQFGLAQYEKELVQGFIEFLTSEDRDIEDKVMNSMNSILSATLVAANISPDLLRIDNYRGCNIILDTNILFPLVFSEDTRIVEAFEALGDIVQKFGIKLYVAEFTLEEYERVKERTRNEFKEIFKNYPRQAINSMSRNSGFARTVLDTKCKTEEDIDRCFNTTMEAPSTIGEAKISKLTGDELSGSTYNISKDKTLYSKVASAWLKHRNGKKPDQTVIHDVRLMKLVEEMNKKGKTFVLTMDTTMEALALEQISEKEDPLWQSLYSLIQILALNAGGTDFDPTDIAPLIRIFVEFEELGKSFKYDRRDMLLLSEKKERIRELPPSTIIHLLNKYHKARMTQTDVAQLKEIELEIDRALIRTSSDHDQTIQEKDEEINRLQKENIEKDTTIRDGEVLKLWILFSLKTFFAFFISIFLYLLFNGEIHEAIRLDQRFLLFQMLIEIGAPAIYIWKSFFKTIDSIKKLN